MMIIIFHYAQNIIQLPDREQCLAGSLTGAVASQKVTEAFTKVGYPPMEMAEVAQTQKPALLEDS